MQTELNDTKAMIGGTSALHNMAIQQYMPMPEDVAQDTYFVANKGDLKIQMIQNQCWRWMMI